MTGRRPNAFKKDISNLRWFARSSAEISNFPSANSSSNSLGFELVIVARNIARIFLQSAINLGLNIIICPTIQAEEGDDLEIVDGKAHNRTSGKSFPIEPLPKARQAIIDAGGLIPYTRRLLLASKP